MQSNIQQYYPSFYTFYESHFFPGQTPVPPRSGTWILDLSHDPIWAIWLAEVRKFHQHHDRICRQSGHWWNTIMVRSSFTGARPPICNNLTTMKTHRDSSPIDNVIKWKRFPRYWPFWGGTTNDLGISLWCGALVLSLIGDWTNGCANNRDTGDLRLHRAHYDVTVMQLWPSRDMPCCWLIYAE